MESIGNQHRVSHPIGFVNERIGKRRAHSHTTTEIGERQVSFREIDAGEVKARQIGFAKIRAVKARADLEPGDNRVSERCAATDY